jgi:SAM-dependent methyltransferase
MNRVRNAVAQRVSGLAPGRQFRLDLARRTIESFAGDRPIRVLDAGCEDGSLAATLGRRHPAWTVVGADINDEALDRARADASARGLHNVEFVCMDITRPFAANEYDVVAAVECLAEIPDDGGVMASLTRALKPDGLLLVHAPERSWRPVLPGSPKQWQRETRHGYTAEELMTLLEGVGLEGVEIEPTTHATLHVAEEIRARTKRNRLRLRAVVYPALALAVRLERAGITGGEARALFASARKPSERTAS